jgi:hypothetical protein
VIQSLLLVVCFGYGRAWTRVQLVRTGRVKLRRAFRDADLNSQTSVEWEQVELTWLEQSTWLKLRCMLLSNNKPKNRNHRWYSNPRCDFALILCDFLHSWVNQRQFLSQNQVSVYYPIALPFYGFIFLFFLKFFRIFRSLVIWFAC